MSSPAHEQPQRWYALQVKTRCERQVGQQLQRQGHQICVPVQKQLRQWSDRRKWVEMVLFTNYVFVVSSEKLHGLIESTPHALGFVKIQKKPVPLRAQDVALIRQLDGLPQPVEVSPRPLQAGAEVEIVSGNLRGLQGQVVSLHGSERVQLALPSLRCFALVEMSKRELRIL